MRNFISYILNQFKSPIKSNFKTMTATAASNNYRNKPIVIIFGCTGTGKTKLSVQLAKQYENQAEIINADSQQVKIKIKKTTSTNKSLICLYFCLAL